MEVLGSLAAAWACLSLVLAGLLTIVRGPDRAFAAVFGPQFRFFGRLLDGLLRWLAGLLNDLLRTIFRAIGRLIRDAYAHWPAATFIVGAAIIIIAAVFLAAII